MKGLLLYISIMLWFGNNLWQQTVVTTFKWIKMWCLQIGGFLIYWMNCHISQLQHYFERRPVTLQFLRVQAKNLKAFYNCTHVNIKITFHTIWVPNKAGSWIPLAAVWVKSFSDISESLKKVEAGYLSFLLFHLSICSNSCLKRFFVSSILQSQMLFLCIHICFFTLSQGECLHILFFISSGEYLMDTRVSKVPINHYL